MANALLGEIEIVAPDGKAWTFRLTANHLITLGKEFGREKPFQWLAIGGVSLEERRAILHQGALQYQPDTSLEDIGELMTSRKIAENTELWKRLVCAAFNVEYEPEAKPKKNSPKAKEESPSSIGPGEGSSTKLSSPA